MTSAILTEIEKLPDFDADFALRVKNSAESRRSTRNVELGRKTKNLEEVNRKIANLTEAIAAKGFDKDFDKMKTALDDERIDLEESLSKLSESFDELILPSMEEIREKAKDAIRALAVESQEFGRLMRRLVPRLEVYPVRACDGGAIVLRARMTLDLTPLVTVAFGVEEELATVLCRDLSVDLFEPPQRIALREQIVKMRADGVTEKDVAGMLNITVTAAQKAASLQRVMDDRGLVDPYVEVSEPPDDCSRLRRHFHPRYRFEPLETFPAA